MCSLVPQMRTANARKREALLNRRPHALDCFFSASLFRGRLVYWSRVMAIRIFVMRIQWSIAVLIQYHMCELGEVVSWMRMRSYCSRCLMGRWPMLVWGGRSISLWFFLRGNRTAQAGVCCGVGSWLVVRDLVRLGVGGVSLQTRRFGGIA